MNFSMKVLKGSLQVAHKHDCPLICPIKNEITLLPSFLEHHRKIGFTKFVFIDNQSTDGALGYLLEQSDCVVVSTTESFYASRFAMDWIDYIANAFFEGKWIVYADADEHLTIPDYAYPTIQSFVAGVDQEGYDTVCGLMLDMYPDGDYIQGAVIDPKKPVQSQLKYFDRDYIIRRRPQRPFANCPAPVQMTGGPRCRILSNIERERKKGWMSDVAQGQIDRFIGRVPSSMLPLLFKLWPITVPAMHKRPINYVHSGFRYNTSHDSTNERMSPWLLTMRHYKLCNEIANLLKSSAVQEHHYRPGIERYQLMMAIRAYKNTTLM